MQRLVPKPQKDRDFASFMSWDFQETWENVLETYYLITLSHNIPLSFPPRHPATWHTMANLASEVGVRFFSL